MEAARYPKRLAALRCPSSINARGNAGGDLAWVPSPLGGEGVCEADGRGKDTRRCKATLIRQRCALPPSPPRGEGKRPRPSIPRHRHLGVDRLHLRVGGAEGPDLVRDGGGVFALVVGAGFQPVGAALLSVGDPGGGRGGEEEAGKRGKQGEAGHGLVLNGQPHHRLGPRAPLLPCVVAGCKCDCRGPDARAGQCDREGRAAAGIS